MTPEQRAAECIQRIYSHQNGLRIDACLVIASYIRAATGDRCPDCNAAPGAPHDHDCPVAYS